MWMNGTRRDFITDIESRRETLPGEWDDERTYRGRCRVARDISAILWR